MGFFGKNEKELKEWDTQLTQREKELDARQHQIERAEADVGNQKKVLEIQTSHHSKKESELLEHESRLATEEQDLATQRLAATKNHSKEMRKAFKDMIDGQFADIEKRSHEVDERMKALAEKEGELATRERNVREAELKAENGFAALNQKSIRELEEWEKAIEQHEQLLKKREEQYYSNKTELENQLELLRRREDELRKAEIARDAGFAEDRRKLDEELATIRKNHEEQITVLHQTRLQEVDNSIIQVHQTRIEALNKELDEHRTLFSQQCDEQKSVLSEKEKTIAQLQAELEGRQCTIDLEERRLQNREARIEEREAKLDENVESGIEEKKRSFEREIARFRGENEDLRNKLEQTGRINAAFDDLKRRLGDKEPEQILKELNDKEESLRILRQQLMERPSVEMRLTLDELEREKGALHDACERLSADNTRLKNDARTKEDLEFTIQGLESENKSLITQRDTLEASNNQLTTELKRFQASYEREEEREVRIRDIETPYFTDISSKLSDNSQPTNEIDWLEGISNSCIEYGLRFPKRILYAFHTALKTFEWSPITVLAGVSGTGKSELPRLYSHFGGMSFLPLSVQPNWDSQESMLGFFNSIDNKFDAQPVLRFLAQSQLKRDNNTNGLFDYMNLILLDEMNLAHVELYFAEFLSKLELRRGTKDDVPNLEVKLGSGIQPYNLPLGRNVLWVGTMNQDETTKSLSDKVLDRGILIHFPRPTRLERRKELKRLPQTAPLLLRKTWQKWWNRKATFNDEQILPYKKFVEDMNLSLSKVGRALGHRVWQSVEYYMANYPTVMFAKAANDEAELAKAMKTAFEDQLVQKVMPKLRGIETRGKSKTECLDQIRQQLVNEGYRIVDDFDLACEFGYGQFIWNSANYLKEDDDENETINTL